METIRDRTRNGQFQSLLIGLGEESIQYVGQSQNRKTGVLPAQFIGKDREESEATCRICPLWKDNTCYAQDGSVQLGHNSILRGMRTKGYDRSIQQALETRRISAHYMRFGAIGDPGSIAPDVYIAHEKLAREAGLGVISYTHQWYMQHAQHLKTRALASADTIKDMIDATAAGWRVAVHVDENGPVFDGHSISEKPQGTLKNGIKYFLCPAQRPKSTVTCNTCGLCDRQKATKYDVIVFKEHGQQDKFKKQREKRQEEEHAQAVKDFPPPPPLPLSSPLVQLDTSALKKPKKDKPCMYTSREKDTTSRENVALNGEIFTPFAIVDDMLPLVPEEVWADPSYVFIEPTCGNGQFLLRIIEKRLEHGIALETAFNTLIAMEKNRKLIREALDRLLTEIILVRETNTQKRSRLLAIAMNNIFSVNDSLKTMQDYAKGKGELASFLFLFDDPTGEDQIIGFGTTGRTNRRRVTDAKGWARTTLGKEL